MKKLLLFTILSFSTLNLRAQLANSSFENWTNLGTYEEPDNWATYNVASALGGPLTVSKTTDKYAGSYAIRLESKSGAVLGKPDTIPGAAVAGGKNSKLEPIGYAFSARPSDLTGYFKYAPAGTDNGFIGVQLTKWNTEKSKRDTVAQGFFVINKEYATYTKFTAPLFYTSNTTNPDTALVLLSASLIEKPIPGSVLFVDELSFSGITSIFKSERNETGISLYPNPVIANQAFVKNIPANASLLEIADLTGKKIESIAPSSGETALSTEKYNSGMYIYTLRGNSGEVLHSGKFHVTK